VGLALEPSAVVEKLSRVFFFFFFVTCPFFPYGQRGRFSRDPRSVKKRESERGRERERKKDINFIVIASLVCAQQKLNM
jgi:hypothetical protein